MQLKKMEKFLGKHVLLQLINCIGILSIWVHIPKRKDLNS